MVKKGKVGKNNNNNTDSNQGRILFIGNKWVGGLKIAGKLYSYCNYIEREKRKEIFLYCRL